MPGFVPQQVHRQRAAEASAQDAEGEQGLLRDPPPPGSGCHLVIGIHTEAENVQQEEKCCDESLHVGSRPFFDAGRMLYYTSYLFCWGQIILQPRCFDDCPLFCDCECYIQTSSQKSWSGSSPPFLHGVLREDSRPARRWKLKRRKANTADGTRYTSINRPCCSIYSMNSPHYIPCPIAGLC
jgi:hypothetical protein